MKDKLAKSVIAKGKYDFLDFGASKGGSIEFAKIRLGGKRGAGIDINPKRVEKMKKAGYDAIVGDLTNLWLPANCVKFVLMSHILEHLPNLNMVKKAIASAQKAATDYLVITGPFFDEDKYLAAKGFKFHWSDYIGHTCHLTVKQLIQILDKLKLNNYELYLRLPIIDSSSEHIHSLDSPKDSLRYDPAIHPPKEHFVFKPGIWTDFVCYIQLKNVKNWKQLTRAYKNQVPYLKQKGKNKYIWANLVKRHKKIHIGVKLLKKIRLQPPKSWLDKDNDLSVIIEEWQGN